MSIDNGLKKMQKGMHARRSMFQGLNVFLFCKAIRESDVFWMEKRLVSVQVHLWVVWFFGGLGNDCPWEWSWTRSWTCIFHENALGPINWSQPRITGASRSTSGIWMRTASTRSNSPLLLSLGLCEPGVKLIQQLIICGRRKRQNWGSHEKPISEANVVVLVNSWKKNTHSTLILSVAMSFKTYTCTTQRFQYMCLYTQWPNKGSITVL